MKKFLSYIYLMFILVNISQGQMAIDTIKLPEVRLIENRANTHNIGTKMDVIKTASLNEGSAISLSSLLSSFSSIYIKKYGALATPASRGTYSSHTLVLWNGIPINSIANGLSDFSSIYCHNFSDVVITKGGDASVFGSGAIGGCIHLNTNSASLDKKKFLFSATKGSYGLNSNSLKYAITYGKLTASFSFHDLNHKNNFEYRNIAQAGHPLSRNEYGKIKSNSQNLDLFYRLNKNTGYSLNFWSSNLDREVSQNMTTPSSDAKQYDDFKRVLFSLNHRREYLYIAFKQAYLQEDFRYTELLKDIDSKYIADSYISDAEIKLFKGNYLINFGSSYILNQINNNNYTFMQKQEGNITIFTALQYRSETLDLNTVLRKEYKTAYKVPLIPLIALQTKISNSVQFRIKLNRNFRFPTFNDRFWIGAGSNGNPDLNAEDAWNKEAGFDYNKENIKLSFTAFNLNVSDMIIWQQSENGNWMPNNIKDVFSRGVELTSRLNYSILSLGGNYTFNKSTNENTTNNLDNSVGEQLRYVPLHKANFYMQVKKYNLMLNLNNSYTSGVITTYGTPNNKTLDSFILTDLSIKYDFINFPFSVKIKVKNLMDKSYVTYQNYPNPGREYLFTLEYNNN